LDVGGHTDLESGIFYGFAGLSLATASSSSSEAANPPNPNSQDQTLMSQAGQAGDSYTSSELHHLKSGTQTSVYPMVMSIGWNPFYKNSVRSVEVHIIHEFKEDFYNALMNLSILGFIRHEQDYSSLESLVADIRTDIEVTKRSLQRPAYSELAKDLYLTDLSWATSQKDQSLES